MLMVRKACASCMTTSAPLCTKRVWQHVQPLVVGDMLADLASGSLGPLRGCEDDGVRFVIRRTDYWKPQVDDSARGQVTPEFFPGVDLDALLEAGTLGLDGHAMDADVHVGGAAAGPIAVTRYHGWNADRLNEHLREIDQCIAEGEFPRGVTLGYTCLEGFYRAFVTQCVPDQANKTEIIALSKIIKKFLSETIDAYADEALTMVTHISHTVDKARNKFSEAHFEHEAARWLAVYIRDLVNTQIRLLLHFF